MIGYQSFSVDGFLWRKVHGTLVPLSMPHVESALTTTDARRLLQRHGALLIRWESEFDCGYETAWWHVVKSSPEDFAALSRNTRDKVKRGLKRFSVNPADRSEILEEGYDVYSRAFARYETFEPILSREMFNEAISTLPAETEFWIVRDRRTQEMVAFSENFRHDRACFYLSIWFCPVAIKAYAGYLLIHEMNKHYLNDEKLLYVSDGARNISHRTGIHDFLISKFGFRRAYAKLHIVYSPWLALAVRVLYPVRAMFAKAESGSLRKIAILLAQESIRRDCLERTIDGDG